MIVDYLENAHTYMKTHPRFPEAFDFLSRQDLAELPDGKHEISGDQIFAMVSNRNGISRDDAKLEAHRKFIDIQYVLSGTEDMGWKNKSRCSKSEKNYDSESDAEFFRDRSDCWITVKPGSFAAFFPQDAHAPLVSSGKLHKVVVKVAV